MPIDVTCDACGARFKAPDAAAGKKGKCKKCGALIVVPVPEPVPAAGADDDMYDIAEPAAAPAKPYKPATPGVGGGAIAPAPAYNPPPTATSAALMARGVVPKSANAGAWKKSNNPPTIMKVLGIITGVVLILLGLLLLAAPIIAMMSDKTGKTIRFRGVFFGVGLIGTGVTAIVKAFGKAGG